jgi:hypothetical protein
MLGQEVQAQKETDTMHNPTRKGRLGVAAVTVLALLGLATGPALAVDQLTDSDGNLQLAWFVSKADISAVMGWSNTQASDPAYTDTLTYSYREVKTTTKNCQSGTGQNVTVNGTSTKIQETLAKSDVTETLTSKGKKTTTFTGHNVAVTEALVKTDVAVPECPEGYTWTGNNVVVETQELRIAGTAVTTCTTTKEGKKTVKVCEDVEGTTDIIWTGEL